MQTGKLNRRIQIQSQTASQDAAGGVLESWSPLYSCWANIDIQNSQLIYSTAEFMDKVTHRFTIRFTSSVVISAKQRIVYVEPTTRVCHTYTIETVVNQMQGNKWLTILAYELEASE